MKKLPNFLIIGAAKAGTTSLFDMLKQHSQVFLPFSKEPMFFSHDENYERGLDWYSRTFFKGAQSFPARGEATPHYLYWSNKTAPRIRDSYQDSPIKFIVTLRNPVARAYSWYGNMLKDGTENLSFEQALEMEDQRLEENNANLYQTGSMQYGYYRGGCYLSLLTPFLDLFPIQDFLFILQEDIISDHATMSSMMLSFLGVNAEIRLSPVKSNGAALPNNRKLHRLLKQRNKFKDYLKMVIPFEFRYKLKARIMRSNLKEVSFPGMEKETGRKLRERYLPEILALQKVIGRDLSGWMEE